MNKLCKSFVIIITILFLLSPICIADDEETIDITGQIESEDGSLFEKIIAQCIGGIAETILDLTTRRYIKCWI